MDKNITILYNQKYIPFDLYIYSIKYLLQNCNVSIITNISQINSNANYLILFINHYDQIYDVILPDNTNIIFITADYLFNFTETDQHKIKTYINKNSNRTYIWEYSPLNISYYKTNEIAANVNFIPLLYNIFLEKLYRQYTIAVPYNEKPIDVLFVINGIQDRRAQIIDRMKDKCKTVVLSGNDNIKDFCVAVENSKIIVNVYSKEINRPFDYYRFSLLYSNRVLVINEAMKHHDFSIEHNLVEFNEVMINAEYDDLVDTVGEYLKKSGCEIADITEKSYQIFKKHDMKQYIMDFFESHNT
jgi:hypothetical protein